MIVTVIWLETKEHMEIIAYHSRSTMGCPKSDHFFMNTSKSVVNIQGNYVWVVEGLGRSKYKLKMRYLADTIGEGEGDFTYSFSSENDGELFDIELHDYEWFDEFKRSVANFSIAPTELKEPYLQHFRDLSGVA